MGLPSGEGFPTLRAMLSGTSHRAGWRMNLQPKLLVAVLALVSLFLTPLDSRAQSFGLGASASPNPVLVGNSILYTIDVTNLFGFSLNNVFVTNAISGEVLFDVSDATNSLPGNVTAGSDGIIFQINTLIDRGIARLSLRLTPTAGGSFTNQITVAVLNRTNTTTTNVITAVTFPEADLAVGMTNVTSGVLTNDTTVIGLLVTNLGPSSASGVVVTNTLPTSFKLLSVSPAAVSNSFVGGKLALSLGTMTSGSSTQLLLTVQPTSPGSFNLSATVSATGILDTNTVNSTVTNSMIVADFLASDLTVTPGAQQFNRQTGLWEMNVLLRNNAATNVPAARIAVAGLTNGTWLYNAVGTNTGVPYVLYNSPLAGGASVSLLLEFYVLIRAPLTNFNLQAFAVPAISLSAPTNSGTTITNYVLSSGGFLIEFAATPGRTYTIVYSDNLSFSNALLAQPAIVAPANRVQWIDNGPPKTVSHPSTTTSRFYRVFQAQ
jgi:uncharacterized repeat protein (TIGR01451 family)